MKRPKAIFCWSGGKDSAYCLQLGKDMKSGYKIDWADEALHNLDSIIEYLQNRWTDREISKFFKKLDNRLDVISKNPLAYPEIELKSNIRRSILTEQTTIY